MRNQTGKRTEVMAAVALAVALLPALPARAQVADPVAATNEVLARVNQERTSRGLAPFARHCDLDRAAQRQADDMATHNFFPANHQGSDGSTPDQRIRDTGYPAPMGENLFAGSPSPETVVAEWMKSTRGHREAILDPNRKEAGLAVAYGAGTQYRYYWALTFGGGGGKACAPQTTLGPDPLHLTAVTSDGKLWHSARKADGSWLRFDDVSAQAGGAGVLVDVDTQRIGSGASAALHLGAVNSDGRLWHTFRRPDGAWLPFGDVEAPAGERGRFVSVALATENSALHLFGVTSDGKLWHTVRSPEGAWQPFGDVTGQAGDPGALARVAVTLLPDWQTGTPMLNVLCTASDGRLLQTIRFADGRWSAFFHLDGIRRGAPNNFVEIDSAFTTSPSTLHVFGVLSDGRILDHTERFTSRTLFADLTPRVGNRGPFVKLSVGATGENPQLLQMAAITADGELWHTIRNPDGSWLPFGNVKGAAGDPGRFVGVSIEGVPR